jgi:hypothetical protein
MASNLRGRRYNNQIHDATDGTLYKEAINKLRPGQLCISLNINTDGAPITTSTSHVLWPMVANIVELEQKSRESFKNMIFLGFWLARHKPNYKLFGDKTIEELKKLMKSTIILQSCQTVINIHTFLGDLPAKASVLNVKQFNGYYGCVACDHESEYITVTNKKNKQSKKQIYGPRNFNKRTAEEFNECALLVDLDDEVEDIYGIRGTCAFTGLIDLPHQAPFDFMHLVLQGHSRWLIGRYFFSEKAQPYNISKAAPAINKLILNIKSPHNLYRRVSSIDKFCHWKSSEIEHFIFHLAIPLLYSKMPPVYFYKLTCYIFGVRLLYEPVDSLEDVDLAEELLKNYHNGLENDFGETAYLYTIHAHLHLADQVRLLGPLKSNSAYPFEGALFNMQNLFNGTRGFLNQIVTQISLTKAFAHKLEPMNFNSNILYEFCHNNFSSKDFIPRFHNQTLEQPFLDIYISKFNLNSNFNGSNVLVETRAESNKTIYHSLNYNRKQNSNSYTVNFNYKNSDCFGEIEFFVELNDETYCFVNKFKIETDAMNTLPLEQGMRSYFYKATADLINRFYYIVLKENYATKDFVLVNIKQLQYKCVVVEVNNCFFLSKLKYEFQHD